LSVTRDDLTPAGDEPVELADASEIVADEADELDDLLGMAGAEGSDAEPAADAPDVSAAVAVEDADVVDSDAVDTPGADTPAAVATDEAPAVPARPRRPSKIGDVRDQTELRRMIGKWFVVHTYAGYEQRVKDNLTNRIDTYDAWDRILEIVIPTEEVTEYKKGKKVVSDKKFLPGYVLVRMDMDDDTWGIVRHTPAVTGFVGANGVKPVPLSVREVASTLKIPKEYVEETEASADASSTPATEKVQIDIDMEVGETVRVTTGPFADFTGTIAEINLDQAKLRVLVSVFGRETPIEIPFNNVASI
jgi:transcriptional antiterminator NusG